MKCGRHAGELVEIVEIGERAVAADIVEVAHIGRTIHGNENAVLATDPDSAREVSVSFTDVAVVEQNIVAPALHILPPNVLSCAQPLIALQAQAANPAGSFVYAWSASNGGHIVLGDSLLTLCVDAAGTYTLLTTNPENGCTASISVDVVSDFAAPGAAIAVSSALNCNNSTVLLTSASTADPGTLDHNWTAPDGSVAGTGTDPVFAATLPGDYLLVVSNTQNGCTSTATATVLARDPVKSGIIDVQNVSCFGGPSGSASATATGGAGAFTYLWSNDATTPAIANLVASTYTVTVSDGENCTATAEATIQQPDQLTAVAGSTPPTTNAQATAGGLNKYTLIAPIKQKPNSAAGKNANNRLPTNR